MFKNALLLTLGHGSSAVLIIDHKVVCGYQLERITGVKGDSRFPQAAIEEIEKFFEIPEGVAVLISHWHPTGDLEAMNQKHYNPQYLKMRFNGNTVISTSQYITHHSAHAYSALAYNYELETSSGHIMVADGFGNCGEVFSVYKCEFGELHLVKRVYGYNNSLGLMYQYATDFVGLKMNQDEWKLNAMASSVKGEAISGIKTVADIVAADIIAGHRDSPYFNKFDPIISIGALSATHEYWYQILKKSFVADEPESIAFFLQSVVETVMTHWIDTLDIQNLTVVGGCFLNVQLNGFLAEKIPGDFCAMPLSGDEGAAFGIYKILNNKFKIPYDLCWGDRYLYSSMNDRDFHRFEVYEHDEEDKFKAKITELLKRDRIVNVIRGKMEYGPRAYCNTSTLAIPSVRNKMYINKVNGRHHSMPMCPVLSKDQYYRLFGNKSFTRSIEHMIVAVPYKDKDWAEEHGGVSHRLIDGTLTGRPQVVYHSNWMHSIVEVFGPLINTSFNNHGSPICRTMGDVRRTHQNMLANDTTNRVHTLVLANSKLDPTASDII